MRDEQSLLRSKSGVYVKFTPVGAELLQAINRHKLEEFDPNRKKPALWKAQAQEGQ
jgi:hypothetical protein